MVLYGLKEAPRAWYVCLRDFLIENGFRIGKADSTLFTRTMGKYLFLCQIYIDDIIFGSTNKSFCDEFSKIMTDMFEISMMGVLTFFLRFQIKQAKDGAFISQIKYTRDILKKFGMDKAKPIKTPMGTNGHLDLDLGVTSVDQKVYCSMIESLLYLYASRPDIMLSVCMCVSLSSRSRLNFKSKCLLSPDKSGILPDKSSQGLHRTSPVSSPDKSDPLSINPLDRFLARIGLLSSSFLLHR
jgi:hypothetical protein